MTIKKIGVFGAGTMGGGSGIAHLAASNGFEVVLYSVEQRFIESAIKSITGLMDRKIDNQRMTVEEKQSVLKRITVTTNIEDFSSVDLVIEAIYDDLEVKKSALEKLDKICRDDIVFCSNSSNILITELASATSRPDKVVGLRFLNPPQIMRQVQVIRGCDTIDDTVTLATKAVELMGKKPVVLRDKAVCVVKDRGEFTEDSNLTVKLGLYYPKGPCDMVFNDVQVTL